MKKVQTFGELKKQCKGLPGVREEMRVNLIKKLRKNERLFPDLIGYDDTVLPELVNAILCGHNIIILGERGQGKSRIIRSLVDFLDEEIPAIDGCPIHDNPFDPICTDCIKKRDEMGDALPIDYIPRDRRLIEKLATSDVSTADLIGEVDPIKIAEGRTLDDESAVHFGLIPRAHRSIFAINELPDLAEKIQVAFFNVMEENDFQVKGFPVRLPLDILVVATANPEDYTNRGRIITPLKDRFDVQIRTHYPLQQEYEIEIMEQETRKPDVDGLETYIPQFIKKILAEITFQARNSPDINQHSGVSCRVSIRSYESIIGSALRRSLRLGEKRAVPRITDIESTFPAILGKLEPEYEAAERGEEELIDDLTKRAIKIVFDEHFKVEDLSSIIGSFQNGMSAQISQHQPSDIYMEGLKVIPGMKEAIQTLVDPETPDEASSAIEFVLEGLHLSNKLNCEVTNEGMIYK
ncbi:MAG: magnesium chelatase [Deltaproteobacteria bacterium]|nr:magnesium chelatase [Deltaproteobacteria bacterium]MBW1814025.1 magnesium chelatase [Deltaproteobacteria bacterium]MBW1846906.1 magnesium chelatase [Deltaproteobacteria bacterium]MBW1984842.1 magnesium chelatase [Deltaproteobacteria bacterium]MBW2179177.1 magnesium chelatase [Deltaproteobacteria bacterium]